MRPKRNIPLVWSTIFPTSKQLRVRADIIPSIPSSCFYFHLHFFFFFARPSVHLLKRTQLQRPRARPPQPPSRQLPRTDAQPHSALAPRSEPPQNPRRRLRHRNHHALPRRPLSLRDRLRRRHLPARTDGIRSQSAIKRLIHHRRHPHYCCANVGRGRTSCERDARLHIPASPDLRHDELGIAYT